MHNLVTRAVVQAAASLTLFAAAVTASGCTIHTHSGHSTTPAPAFHQPPQQVFITHRSSHQPSRERVVIAARPTAHRPQRSAAAQPSHATRPSSNSGRTSHASAGSTKPAQREHSKGRVQLKDDRPAEVTGGSDSISVRVAKLARQTQLRLKHEAAVAEKRKRRMNTALARMDHDPQRASD